MRKLNNWQPVNIDNRNQARTSGQHCFLPILGPPIHVVSGKLSVVKPDGKNFGELVDVKWANGNDEALEQSMGEFSFLLLNAK
jgi:hypothetical protein